MDDPVALVLELGEDRGQRLLELLGARAALRDFRRICAVRYSVQLLRGGEKDRAVIRDRVMARYRIQRTTAYLCIDQAVDEFAKLSVFEPCSRTQPRQNDPVPSDQREER